MEEQKEKRPFLIRSVCASCSVTFLGAMFYLLLVGFNLVAVVLLAVSFGGLSATSAAVSEGILEFFPTLLELFVEGISSALSAIASLFNF